MIKKIKLVNWKTHKNSELEFSEGTNVIVGINGAGKSSIMDAISFALFGTFPKLQSKTQKIDDLLTNKPIKAKEAEVILEFSYEGKDYSVLRRIERGKTTYAELRVKEGERFRLMEGSGSQRVTEMIEKILRLDYELFSRAIYSEQNEIDYFIKLSPGDRAKKIDNLLRIDKFEKARATIVNLKTRLEGEKSSLQKMIKDEDIKNKEAEIQDISKKIDEEENQIKRFTEEYEELKVLLEENKKSLDKLENKKIELEKLIEKLSFLRKNYYEEQKNINKIKEIIGDANIDEINKKILEYSSKILSSEKDYAEKNDIYEKLFSEKKTIETEINVLSKRNKDIQNQLKEIAKYIQIFSELSKKYVINIDDLINEKRKKLDDINSEISVLEYKIKDAKNISLQIEKLENKCPVCNSDITEDKKHHLLHIKEKEIKEIENTLEASKNQKKIIELELKVLDNDKKIIEEAKRYVADSQKLEKELKENQSMMEKLERNIVFIEKDLINAKTKLEEIKKQLDKIKEDNFKNQKILDKLKELKDSETRLKEIQHEIKTSEEKIMEIEKIFKKEEYYKLKNDYEKERDRASEIKAIISEKQKSLEEKRNLLKQKSDELKRLKDQKDYILKLEESLKSLSIFEAAIENTQGQLREKFIESVNTKMSEIWPDLYPYADYNDIRLYIDEGNYVLQLVNKSGEWVNAELVSGGERTMSCLTLRIAFSLVLVPHLNWLILDEPTHNLDEKSVQSLNECLRDRIKEFVSQVFIVTHDNNLKNAASGELYRIHRNKDEDGYSEVIRETEY